MNKNIFTVGDAVQVRGDKVGIIEAFTKSDQYGTILCQIRYTPKIVQNEYLADIQHYNKDYTILSYGNSESLDKCEIKSVRRNSDGVVFTVGDKMILGGYNGTIKMFQTSQHGLQIIGDTFENSGHICNAKLLKQPLFTTEDGKEIFEGDMAYGVRENYTIWSPKMTSGGPHNGEEYKWFSTKEAAEEYILMNKPCLSINDIVGNWKLSHSRLQEHLKQLVKSKLEK